MRICCLSDIHGYLPKVPDCDLLLLGGDYCSDHEAHWWYAGPFAEWLETLAERMKIVGVAGNHDFIFQQRPGIKLTRAWTYLQDYGAEVDGLNVWGSPWQPRFFDWAFNEDEPQLERIWAKIPGNTDILLLHGPPHGYGDFSPYGKVHTGSPSLTAKIKEIKPKLVVCGHIHSGFGRYEVEGQDTIIINASYVDEKYQACNPPVLLEI